MPNLSPRIVLPAVALLALAAGAGPVNAAAEVGILDALPQGREGAALPSQRWRLVGGKLALRWNMDLALAIGIRPGRASLSRALAFDDPLQFDAPLGSVRRFERGILATLDGQVLHIAGERIELAAIVRRPGAARELSLVDAAGREWLYATHLMALIEGTRFRVPTSDLRVGALLAERLRAPGLVDTSIGEIAIDAQARALDPALAESKSCAAPNWPGRGGFVADVLLDAMSVQMMRCRRASGTPGCDGDGPDDGEVVLAPNALLRNSDMANTADVPWYAQFSPSPHDYPYPGNDQHPYLVWNLYRIDSAGRIEQIARSGLKHAFATQNEGCSDVTCAQQSQVLGRGCADLYSVQSNDAGFYLSARRDVIPARGQWGRCGSSHDDSDGNPGDGLAGCDGVQDAPPDDGWRERLVVRERDIDPALNPGARWLFEAWYVVRDDIDIFNTMGHVEIDPRFAFGRWDTPTIRGFQRGSALDAWVASGTSTPEARSTLLATPEGHVRLAVRVTRQGARWRYDYALANHDYSRPVTENAEPNLRVLRNLGFERVSLPYAPGAAPAETSFGDGDAAPANDWVATRAAATLAWQAPGGQSLDWGTMLRYSVVSASPPTASTMTLGVAEAGSPASYAIATLGPDPAGDALVSGFEEAEAP